jgi:hypothetical protein
MARVNGLLLLGAGAALMYLMDPQSGRKRRTELVNQVDAAGRALTQAREAIVRDSGRGALGAVAGALGLGIAMWGYLRGGLRGFALCTLGGGLVASATAARGSLALPDPHTGSNGTPAALH